MKIRISGGDTDAPKVVRYSFWVWIASGAIGLIDSVLFYSVKQALIDATLKNDPSMNPEAVRAGADNFLLLLLISSIIFALLYAYFAYRARDGQRSARTGVTIVVVLHLLLRLLFPVSYLGLIAAVVSIAAVIMLWLPTATAYFKSQV